MLDLSPGGATYVADLHTAAIAVRELPPAPAAEPKLVLRSRVPGRERWYVHLLEDNPRLAAALELVLRSEEGIEEAIANPVTGRVLVRYRPGSLVEPMATLLRRAVAAGPMSQEEFAALRPTKLPGPFCKHLFTAEVACSLSHVVLFGGLCPLGIAATVVLLWLHRGSRTHIHG